MNSKHACKMFYNMYRLTQIINLDFEPGFMFTFHFP